VTGRWRSLCARDADYVLDGGAVALRGVRAEGTVRLAATVAADGSDPDVVRLHEAVAVWSGWSLAAAPPGRTVDVDDQRHRDAPADVPAGIPLRTAFVAAPGTLPRLRYGRSYAVRVRAVDLAGNSLPPGLAPRPGDDAAITAETPFLRPEPVEPPAVALVRRGGNVAPPDAGESMLRMAVRTFNATFDDATSSAQAAERAAAPARTSAHEAELHGALDGPAWASAAQHALLVERDRDLPSQGFELRGPLVAPGEDVRATTYAVLDDDAQIAPYLPDPLCTRVAARLLRHPLADPNAIVQIPLYPGDRAWPDAAPFRIRVYEGAAGEVPRFDEASRTLLVPTPKGVRATLCLSAMLDDDALARLGVWRWIPAAARTAALARQARAGRLWALTPWREVDVVHAVQRPLLRPTMTELILDRPRDATFVRPGIDARVHRATTDRVALHARWHDPRDAEGSVAPSSARRDDVAFTVRVTDPQGYGGAADHVVPDPADENRIALGGVKPAIEMHAQNVHALTHELGDTRYRRIEYHLVATSRFREYMPTELLAELDAAGKPILDGDGHVVTTDEHLTVAGPVERRWVPSAAPPPAPEVLYVVPTFGWTRGADASGRRTSWRRGGGLRIWLDRPWNASGFGEMLAVVLPPAGGAIDPNDGPYRGAVTQWGNDPTWKSPFVSGAAPALAAFPLARTAPDPSGAWLPPGAAPAVATRRRRLPIGILVLVALLLIAIPLGVWWYMSRPGSARSIAAAEQLYATGNRSQARLAWAQISRAEPALALPHVYLARIAREQGEVETAQRELTEAIRLEPQNPLALREMGGLMLATNNPELARRFYVRALEANGTDRVAQGYLGCALVRLQRYDEGRRWLDRAGSGDWSTCTQQIPPVLPSGGAAMMQGPPAQR